MKLEDAVAYRRAWYAECFEHDLGHLLSIGFGIERRFGEKNGMFLGRHTELVVEGVMPDLLHVVPVSDNATFDGMLKSENASFRIDFVADVGIFLPRAHRGILIARSTNDR